jgi:hypothetical protein
MSEFRRRAVLTGLMIAALLTVAAGSAAAQGPGTGSISGTVAGPDGQPLTEVLVTLTDVATGVERAAFTTRLGSYGFGFLSPGEYQLFIERIGFTPRRIEALPVRPGAELQLATRLNARDEGPLTAEVGRYEGGPLAGSRAGAQWLGSGAVRGLAAERGAIDLARLASTADETLSMEGLAPRLASLLVDGVPFRPVAEPGSMRDRFRMTAFPLIGVETAQLVSSPLDVEWTEAAAGFLSFHSRGGAATTSAEARAFWGGSVLPTPSGIERGTASFNDLQGGAVLRGSLLSDSARFSVGAEARQQETLLASAWPNTAGAAAIAAAGSQAGLDLEPYRRAGVGRFQAVSAFGRLDWAVAERHRVDLSAQLAGMPEYTAAGYDGLVRSVDGSDVVAGVGLRSSFRAGAGNDLRLSFTRSIRQAGGPADVAPTFVASEGIAFGSRAAVFTGQETMVRLTDAVHLRSGSHVLKVGAGVAFGSYRYEHRARADGEYWFSDAAALQASRGVLVRQEGPSAAADWSTTPVLTLFAQDRWTSENGVDVLLGVRADHEALPRDRVRRDNEWERLTGLANDEATGGGWRVSPRGSLSWDVQREHQWVLHASAGIFHDRLDPHALAEWQIEDGSGLVRRAVGSLVWPPVLGQIGLTAPTLTLLGPDFVAPRTSRVDAGLVRRLGAVTAVSVSAAVRRTENLVRRTDLNLLALPAQRDQHGRAIYGRLVQEGSLVAATPGTGRRFENYDEVAALTADGSSSYWGVTFKAEHEQGEQLAFVARYTFSETTDNWFGARDGGLRTGRPAGLDAAAEWAKGTSDFDAPHRAVLGVAYTGPAGVRVSGLYRMQSGLPFTPGFRPGVDVNADGYAGNDPAFVDLNIAGVSDLTGNWSCLRESAGRFAARNSCRTGVVHTVDLGVGLSLFRIGGATTELMLEAFDLLEADASVPDAALYLIDPAGSLVVSGDGRSVTLPLLANPSFGEPLALRQPGRRLRLGFSLKW